MRNLIFIVLFLSNSLFAGFNVKKIKASQKQLIQEENKENTVKKEDRNILKTIKGKLVGDPIKARYIKKVKVPENK